MKPRVEQRSFVSGHELPWKTAALAGALALLLLFPTATFAVGTADGGLPIGTKTTSSTMGVYGRASIGTSYTGTAAPTNGLIIEGNVGLGTTLPVNKLDVYSGGIHIGSNTPTSTANALYASSSTLYFNGGAITGNSWYTTGGVNIGTSSAPSAGQLVISVSGQGSYGIIVGSTATGSPLRVFAQSSDHLYLGANNTVEMMWRGAGTGSTGWLAVNYSAISSTLPDAPIDINGNARATSYVTGSDRRWKKDIAPLQDSLGKLERLQGVYFKWRTDEFPERTFNEGRSVGLIAQEVEKVVPEVVSPDGSGFRSLEYEKFAALLVEGLKELRFVISRMGAEAHQTSDAVDHRKKVLDSQSKEIKELTSLFARQTREFDEYKKMHP
jgi:hypothetical protein